jgi:simple sugar transport system permease protein
MDALILTLVSVLAAGTPLVLASLGETLAERAGLANLSLDGTILLSAMAAFVTARLTGSAPAGLAAGILTGAACSGLLSLAGHLLGRLHLAVGFILTLLYANLAYFLGQSHARQEGPRFPPLDPFGLASDSGLGLFWRGLSGLDFLALALIPLTWWYLNRSRSGLALRAVGENPRAAFVRGLSPARVRLLAMLAGGALAGAAGAAYSLWVKTGWGNPQGAEGAGWIALSIVIFGGWKPERVALGAYFFAALQVLSIHLQDALPGVPAQVFQTAPFPVMIVVLFLVNMHQSRHVRAWARTRPWLARLTARLKGAAPAGLNEPFDARDAF